LRAKKIAHKEIIFIFLSFCCRDTAYISDR